MMPRMIRATVRGFIWTPPFRRGDNPRELTRSYYDADEKSSRAKTLGFCKRTGNKDSKSDLGHVPKVLRQILPLLFCANDLHKQKRRIGQ